MWSGLLPIGLTDRVQTEGFEHPFPLPVRSALFLLNWRELLKDGVQFVFRSGISPEPALVGIAAADP